MKNKRTEWLVGRHAIEAAIKGKRREIKKILVAEKQQHKYEEFLQRQGAPVYVAPKQELDAKCPDQPHQGIIAEVGVLSQPDLEDVMANASLFLMLDQVTDPHNLGAVLRSADAFGCDGVIVPAQNSAPVTSVVAKAASGALETVPVITVGNLNKALELLQKEGFWSVGLDGYAEKTLAETDLKGRMVIVMGSEGKGLRPLVAKHCDFLAKIPMTSGVESLNISVATGITLYEASKQRS